MQPASPLSRRDGFFISTDPSLIDLDAVHAYLSHSYWAHGIPKDLVRRSIAGSMAFGVYEDPGAAEKPRQIGFARVISDRATFAYIGDVYILEEFRGRGLGKWLVEVIVAHPDLQGLRRWMLMTRDAHGLYARYGFVPAARPDRVMERTDSEVYTRGTRAG
jgi:N-acetylglutamate synthase-like GNAT family acetyltransferase